jgi:hypothetical protein
MSAFEQRRVAEVFGVVLRDARRHVGISQEHLAELADIDRTYRVSWSVACGNRRLG